MTKWYQFLNRIKFPSPTKALLYRVGATFAESSSFQRFTITYPRYGWTKVSLPQVWPKYFVPSTRGWENFAAAVAFFYGSMSVLEGKPEKAIDRVKAVSSFFFALWKTPWIFNLFIRLTCRLSFAIGISFHIYWIWPKLTLALKGLYTFRLSSWTFLWYPLIYASSRLALWVCSGVSFQLHTTNLTWRVKLDSYLSYSNANHQKALEEDIKLWL